MPPRNASRSPVEYTSRRRSENSVQASRTTHRICAQNL